MVRQYRWGNLKWEVSKNEDKEDKRYKSAQLKIYNG